MIKILHTADNHFKKDRLDECIRCFKYIIDFATKHKPDLIIHAGDLFERNVLINSNEYRAAVKCMIELADVAPIFIIRGNHDPEKAIDIFQSLDTKHEIIYSDRIETVSLGYLESDVKILSLPYINPSLIGSGEKIGDIHISGAGSIKEYINNFVKNIGADNYNFIVGHFTVIGSELANSERILDGEVMFTVEDLIFDEIDAVFLGHIHRSDQEIFNNTNIRYSGSHYKTRFDEKLKPGFYWWEIEKGKAPVIEFENTPAREMIEIEINEDDSKKVLNGSKLDFEIPQNSDVKIIFNMPEGMSSLLDRESIESLCPTNSTLKITKRTVPKNVVRSSIMSTVKTDIDKFKEWARISDTLLTESMIKKFTIITAIANE